MLKFEFTNDQGNNFYLDDINISSTVGMSEASTSRYNVELYPNPAAETMRLQMNVEAGITYSWSLTNASGICMQESTRRISSGALIQEAIGDELPAGFYLLRLNIGDDVITRRVVFIR